MRRRRILKTNESVPYIFRCAVAFLKEVVSVRRSVRRSVRPSVGPSVCPVLFSKVRNTHTRRILCRVSGLVPSFVVLVLIHLVLLFVLILLVLVHFLFLF